MEHSARIVLALDPATSCGWAVGRPVYGRIDSGVWNLKPSKTIIAHRYQKLAGYLATKVVEHAVDTVVMEQPHHRGGKPTEYAYGYLAITRVLCSERGLEFHTAHSREVKKHATGHGDANKREMAAAGSALWGVKSHDEIDALWILDWSLSMVRQWCVI